MDEYEILLEDVTTRLYQWVMIYYETVKECKDVHSLMCGLYCYFEYDWSKCICSGIYNTEDFYDAVKYTNTIFLKGFDWTKDQLRNEINNKLFEKWKSKFIKDKLKDLEKDFK